MIALPDLSVEAIGVIVNTALTIALIAIYIRMYGAQSTQATIAKRQVSLTKSLERPILRVTGYRPADPDYSRYSSSALELRISNIGRTPAQELKIKLTSGFPEESPLSSGQTTVSLRRKNEDDDWMHEWGESMETGESDVVLVGEPLMVGWGKESTEEQHTKALEFLNFEAEDFEDQSQLRLRAELTYTGVGTEFSEEVFDYIGRVETYGGMDAILSHGKRYNGSQGFEITSDPVNCDIHDTQ